MRMKRCVAPIGAMESFPADRPFAPFRGQFCLLRKGTGDQDEHYGLTNHASRI
ncbi:hypothetical protein OpiT1DRAFT_01178 [Opitutaceae bacterium TAV1]|nr:hypothetical protein OpiT1DRAFT_01178 [Opitutaceae bacterium TAV1]